MEVANNSGFVYLFSIFELYILLTFNIAIIFAVDRSNPQGSLSTGPFRHKRTSRLLANCKNSFPSVSFQLLGN